MTVALNRAVIYPDSDGQPMADNTLQFRWIVLIKENLECVFRDAPDVFVPRFKTVVVPRQHTL